MRSLFGLRRPATEERSWTPTFGTITDPSATTVTDSSAMRLSAVYGCVRILSDSISSLPIQVTAGSQPGAPVVDLPPWATNPAPDVFWGELVGQIMTSLLLRGNAYVWVVRDGSTVLHLQTLHPDVIEPERMKNGKMRYTVDLSTGRKVLRADEVMHLRGLTLPGEVKGLSPIEYAKTTIALGLDAQEFGEKFFRNGANPSGLIEVQGKLSDAGAKLLRNTWNDLHKGAKKTGGVAVLTEGAKFSPLSIPPDDAQFLETRAFQVADISRFYGVPPHLLSDASGSTSWGSGLAEQSTNFVVHSLRPWVTRLESGFSALASSEVAARNETRSLTFDVESLMRGAWSTRMSSYALALQNGLLSVNEARAYEGLAAVDGGDDHRAVNYVESIDEDPDDSEERSVSKDVAPLVQAVQRLAEARASDADNFKARLAEFENVTTEWVFDRDEDGFINTARKVDQC